jgi:hypothetical protein
MPEDNATPPAGGAESGGGGAADDLLSSWFPQEQPPAEAPAKAEGDAAGETATPEGDATAKPEGGDGKSARTDATSDQGAAAELEAMKAQLAELEPFKEVVAHLKQQGLSDAEAVKAQLAQQSEEHQLQQAITDHAKTLREQLQAKVDADELTPEQAQAEFDRETARFKQDTLLNHKLAKLEAKELDLTIRSAVAQHPEVQASGPEAVGLIKVLHQATKADVGEIAKFVSDLVTKAQTRAVTAHAAKQAEVAAKFVPADSGTGGAPPAQQGARGSHQSSWADILGIK